MGYRTLRQCVADLERHGHLIRLEEPVDPHLEVAEIQRRCYASQAPAVLFTKVRGCQFPLLGNLFGTLDRARFIFRDTIESVRRAIELRIDPTQFWRKPARYWRAPITALHMRPRRRQSGPVLARPIATDQLPQIVSWPQDGGPFITLPAVFTEDARRPGLMHSNLGMYRVQLAGNEYEPRREVGLHYQIHRGIGVHHRAALENGKPFRVNVFVGGTPAMILSAVMPLPEGMSELGFAGALAGHRIEMIPQLDGRPHVYAQADFCIQGTVDPQREKPEGPFGDHLGYYSLQHDFPVLQVERVTHRPDAIWPFTVVGRPPQEDTTFGELIHELTGPVLPTVLPGVKEVHAVDAAGVHPLLLAIGSERYVPYRPTERPAELLTQAHAILGQGQLSLAKYLWILDGACDPELRAHYVERFFRVLLERVDWQRDIHFQTNTTIDTLDYSGSGLNEGSKVVIAAVGGWRRHLPHEVPSDIRLPPSWSEPRVILPGVVAIRGPKCFAHRRSDPQLQKLMESIPASDPLNQFPLWILCDDSEFTSRNLSNWLWVTFTRSNPATDIYGVQEFIDDKHWGCRGSLLIDARYKSQLPPPLVEDPQVSARVDALAAQGGPLSKYL
ncbi:MAG TPA: UbiD family decarboxylase [Pirellulaceae bacterium]|nr:UbiD family decarboxylase [Pirellulaceae bacterium]